jgi:hypothetical protein
MNGHLLDHPRSVRMPDPHGIRDEWITASEFRLINDRYVVQARSGEGYFYLRLPHDRDPDGTMVATWKTDAHMTHEWEGERVVRTPLSRRFDC